MCIYLGDCPELTYKKQEHIFPAGLGGIQMLPHGVVSDQANEKIFSPLELELMKNSLVAFHRMMYGPGKRGSMSSRKSSKSNIVVGLQDDGEPTLCYTSNGKSYNIPQIFFQGKKGVVSFPKGENISKQLRNLRLQLQKFVDKFVYLPSNYLKSEEVIIGSFDDKVYVAQYGNNRPSVEFVKRLIDAFLNGVETSCCFETVNQLKKKYPLQENSKCARMYAKVAINTLAYLCGAKTVKNKVFDTVKNWIVYGDGDEQFFGLPKIINKEEEIAKFFPAQSHWCIFCVRGNNLNAITCFYNTYSRCFQLGTLPENILFRNIGFICDWKNQKEFKLDEYVAKMEK